MITIAHPDEVQGDILQLPHDYKSCINFYKFTNKTEQETRLTRMDTAPEKTTLTCKYLYPFSNGATHGERYLLPIRTTLNGKYLLPWGA